MCIRDSYRGSLEAGSYGTTAEAQAVTEKESLRLAGLLISVEKKYTKKDGRPFGVMTLEDDSGTLEFTAWDESFSKHEEILKPGAVISCTMRVTPNDGGVRAIGSDFKALQPKTSKKPLRLRIDRTKLTEADLPLILDSIRKLPGKRRLILEVITPSGSAFPLQLGEEFTFGDEQALRGTLDPWLKR